MSHPSKPRARRFVPALLIAAACLVVGLIGVVGSSNPEAESAPETAVQMADARVDHRAARGQRIPVPMTDLQEMQKLKAGIVLERQQAAIQKRQQAELAAKKAAAEKARKAKQAREKAKAEARAKAKAARPPATAGKPSAPMPPAPASCNGYKGNRKTGCTLMLAAGFKIGQMSCLNNLWTKESGWNHRASNRSSGAYGIPQALPGSKMGSVASDWRTNPVTQIRWGLRYIKGRYGTPCGAWGHFQAHNWY